MKLVFEVQLGGGDEYADHVHAAIKGSVHISLDGPGQGRYLGIQIEVADLPYSALLSLGHYREACLNDIHSDLIQPHSYVQFLIRSEDYSRHLLSVAKGHVAYLDV